MIIIALLISISLIIAIGFLVGFLWALKSGQFDDTETPSVRMLFGEKKGEQLKSKIQNPKSKI